MAAPTFTDQYLAPLRPEQRSVLQALRQTIRLAAPEAEECVSYGLPAFRWHGKPIAAFSASANHCSYFPMSSATILALTKELTAYDTAKGTIRFQPAKPLTARLIRMLVTTRMKEIKHQSPARAAKNATGGRPAAKSSDKNSRTDVRVDQLIQSSTHPLLPVLKQLRRLILAIDRKVQEEWKWNSPSYRTVDHFATINLTSRNLLRLILHAGAKQKTLRVQQSYISDPDGILNWLGKDRCMISIASSQDFAKKSRSLKSIIRSWLRQIGG